jgi:hypothetical protein
MSGAVQRIALCQNCAAWKASFSRDSMVSMGLVMWRSTAALLLSFSQLTNASVLSSPNP